MRQDYLCVQLNIARSHAAAPPSEVSEVKCLINPTTLRILPLIDSMQRPAALFTRAVHNTLTQLPVLTAVHLWSASGYSSRRSLTSSVSELVSFLQLGERRQGLCRLQTLLALMARRVL